MQVPKYKDFFLDLPSSTKIACRSWGSPDDTPVLVTHGWLDNLASFTWLIEAMIKRNSRLYIVAIDWPGHGHSQYLGSAYGYPLMSTFGFIFEVLDKLSWDKCYLLGHSMGGFLSTLAAGIIPDRFLGVILLDMIVPYTMSVSASDKVDRVKLYNKYYDFPSLRLISEKESHVSLNRKYVNNYTKISSKPPRYHKNIDALVRAKSMKSQSSKKISQAIMERNMIKKPQGYVVRSDRRLNLYNALWTIDRGDFLSYLKEITAPLLILIDKDRVNNNYFKLWRKQMKFIKNKTVNYKMKGGHYLHAHYPEETAEEIINWFGEFEIII